MRSVLGIDAAWTIKNPSGVALVVETETGWKLTCVESSYERFQCLGAALTTSTPSSLRPKIDVLAILEVCEHRQGKRVDLIAVDMPLSFKSITGRRAADDAVSKKYGGRKASTHSPSSERPGRVSDEMTGAFLHAGYGLQTEMVNMPALIEVYPHPALIELTGAKERLMYKHAKCGRYWPDLKPSERRVELIKQWANIISHLHRELEDVAKLLPLPEASAGAVELKSYEDKLDAAICAWVGVCALTNRARPFGDAEAAIWIPALSSPEM